MAKSPRVHSASFKAQVALAAIKGDRTLSEVASQFQVHVKLVQSWKKQMLEHAQAAFTVHEKGISAKQQDAQKAELFEQIGRLKMELEWLKKKVGTFDG